MLYFAIIISIMNNTKNKNIYSPLVITGYALFSTMVVATFLSTTMPFGLLLLKPDVLHGNVATTMIALTVGALLPTIVAYTVGDKAVKSKSAMSHHFTGVLFGLLAFWMTLSVGYIGWPLDSIVDDQNVSMLLWSLLPAIIIGGILSTLAVAHVRSKYAKKDLLTYKPFGILLLLSIVAWPLTALIQELVNESFQIGQFAVYPFLMIPGIVSYLALRKSPLGNYEKVIWSAIAQSVFFVALFVAFQLMFAVSVYVFPESSMELQDLLGYSGYVFAGIAWIVYLAAQVRALR